MRILVLNKHPKTLGNWSHLEGQMAKKWGVVIYSYYNDNLFQKSAVRRCIMKEGNTHNPSCQERSRKW